MSVSDSANVDEQSAAIYVCCMVLTPLSDVDRANVVEYLGNRYGKDGNSVIERMTASIKQMTALVGDVLLQVEGLPPEVAMAMSRVTSISERMDVLVKWASTMKPERAPPGKPAVT